MKRYLTGHLLVAPPKIADKRFTNTVIYVVNHNPNGAWGIVLNKPNTVSNKELLNNVGVDIDLPGLAHDGGPVNTNSVHFIHSPDMTSNGSTPNENGIYSSGDMDFVEKLQAGMRPLHYRTFIGGCGWSPGQLEKEVQGIEPWSPENSWLVVPATPELVFDFNGMEQWQEAVEQCARSTVAEWMA